MKLSDIKTADRALAYRKHIEMAQARANALVYKAIAEMGGAA